MKLQIANLSTKHCPGAMIAEFLAPIFEYANWTNETMIKIPSQLVFGNRPELDDQTKHWVILLWEWAVRHEVQYICFSKNGEVVYDLPVFEIASKVVPKMAGRETALPATVYLSKRHLPKFIANWDALSTEQPTIDKTCGPSFLKMYLVENTCSGKEPAKEAGLYYNTAYFSQLFPQTEEGKWFFKFHSAVWEYYGEVDVVFKDEAPYDDRLELFMRNPNL